MSEKPCKRCGKMFESKRYKHHRLKRMVETRTCSLSCRQSLVASSDGRKAIANRVRGTGKKHPYVKRGGRHEHRVVVEEALGRRLGPDEVVHHKNGNPRDNRLENLEVLSREEHAREHQLGTGIDGEDHPNAKLTNEQVLAIRDLVKDGVPQPAIAKMFNITQSHVSTIALRKAWGHI